MPRWKLAWTIGGLASLLAAASPAQNLLVNPGFTSSLFGWLPGSGTPVWTGLEGRSAPGAAKCSIPLPIQGPSCLLQCVAATAGRAYDFGGSVRLASLPHPTAKGFVALAWYATPDCSGSVLGGANSTFSSATTSWQTVSATQKVAPPGTQSAVVVPRLQVGAAVAFDAFWDDVFFQPFCSNTATALCLAGSRFRVEASWRTSQGDTGTGQAVPLTADTGYFWFFSPTNVEVVVKVLDACAPPFDRFWVFAAGLTDVEVELTVTDSETGEVNTYTNPLGKKFQPVQDTQAFSTCP